MNRTSSSSQSAVSWFSKNKVTVAGVVLIALLALLGLRHGYRWFDNRKQAAAQETLMGVIQQFSVAQQDKKTDWSSIQKIIQIAYKQHEKTNAAPYLLALEADVYTRLNDHAKALETMNRVIEKSSSSSALTYLYKIKRALMLFDGDTQAQKEGESALQALTKDSANPYFDQARYYLGMYYLSNNQVTQAHEVFKPLLELPFDGEGGSVWAARAREKMHIA